ncbi:MAG: pentapeptide repeat-containing protein [Phycisphaerales bacterium]|nr:pentapeptide repeat-containing protein [Phycisphaerales bacterium]
MKFDILDMVSGEVMFTAKIGCDGLVPRGVKVGLAVRWAVENGVDLRGADLRGADLRGVDLGGVGWVPKIENIHTAVYAAAKGEDALDMEQWHTCGSKHCRAGWVVTLAGAAGKVMEGVYGPGVAAALIYMASDPEMKKVPNWLASDEDALENMKEMAEAEQLTKEV